MEAINKIIDFFKANVPWLIVGLIVGLLIALIIRLLIKKPIGFWGGLIVIVLSIVGSLGLGSLFTKSSEENTFSDPTNEVIAEEINKVVVENWGNTNGGFTIEQIEKAQSDDECPQVNDKVIKLDVKDFGTYVSFYYKDNGVYQNAVFLKTKDGLIYDGMLNVTSTVNTVKPWYSYITFNVFNKYDLSTFRFIYEKDKEPYYFKDEFLWEHADNLVSLSRGTLDFRDFIFKPTYFNVEELKSHMWKRAVDMVGKNIDNYFIKFDKVELIGTADTSYNAINSFYNYLWEQVKDVEYETNKLIDVSKLMCVPIPEELQTNYLISIDKQAEYDNKEYYGVYRCNIAVDCTKYKGNKEIAKSDNVQDYLEENKDKEVIQVKKYDVGVDYSTVNLQFVNKDNSNIENLDLAQAPLVIKFENKDKDLTKTLYLDSKEKLSNVQTILLEKANNWTYIIDSSNLIFDSYKGILNVENNKYALTFEYSYLDNYVVASVGLNPIGNIDTTLIDLAKYPVRIILSNNTNTYQFVFDSNNKLSERITQLVELGDYNYTILSEQLIFSSVSGKLTITPVENKMLFNYALNLTSGSLDFDVSLTTSNSSSSQIVLSAPSSVVDVVRENLSGNKIYNVVIMIYDNNGKIIETLTHTHSGSGICIDDWSVSNLENGTEYIAQIRFADSEDNTKTYLSDIIDFTYDNTLSYTFNYTANVIA